MKKYIKFILFTIALMVLSVFCNFSFAEQALNATPQSNAAYYSYKDFITVTDQFDVGSQTVYCNAVCSVYREKLSTGTINHFLNVQDVTQTLNPSSYYYLSDTDTAINDNKIQCVGVLNISIPPATISGIIDNDLLSLSSEKPDKRANAWTNRQSYNTYIILNV